MRVFICKAWFVVAFCCLAFLSGCAGKQPKTVALSGSEEQTAALLWTRFLNTKRPAALDADIRLGWDIIGSKGGLDASLQIQQPAHLRFAANDPLGRAFMIVVADATSFTMADNREGHVSQGTIHSRFWRSYVPPSLRIEDLFPLLGGFLSGEAGRNATASRDKQSQGFWYYWKDARHLRHYVLLNQVDGTMRQHVLIDVHGDSVLDVQYADYRQDARGEYIWPWRLRISGAAITGVLSLHLSQLYSHDPKEKVAFRLAIPPHFTVEQVP